jgi:endonuclease/exonuclease/phosphatase (EEP) superfamily protein YafD
MDKDKSQMLLKRIAILLQQQQQAEILKSMKKCEYPIIICGDMNNSTFRMCIEV